MIRKMHDREHLYLKLPNFLQNIACSYEGWHINRSRFGKPFQKLLLEAEERTYWSAAKIHDYRDQRLRAFINHCYQTVPFYRRRFQELRLSPGEIKTLDDLKKLPILTKKNVQDNYHYLVSEAVPTKHQIIAHTSGTTGSGLRFGTVLRSISRTMGYLVALSALARSRTRNMVWPF